MAADTLTNRVIVNELGPPALGNSLVITPLPTGLINFKIINEAMGEEGDDLQTSITLYPQQCQAILAWLNRQI